MILDFYPIFQIFKESTTTQKPTEGPIALPQTQNMSDNTDIVKSSEIRNEVPKTLPLAPKPTPRKPTIDAPNCVAYNYNSTAGRNMTIKLCSKKPAKQERLKLEQVITLAYFLKYIYTVHRRGKKIDKNRLF